ncbi:aminoglycoside phosphotransferase family protein [Nonomuraea longicatena]|uniref:Aminoglycoside phosphotransferase family protein n=1 Tax=Nonomuraea longicatena TaxID=83682 RepID=A0ABN1QKX8_9ACTN
MESRTKRRLTPAELDDLTRRAVGAGVRTAEELTDGYANAVWRLRLDDDRDVVLKLAPHPDLELLSFERHILRMEAESIGLAAGVGVPVAELVRAGFDDPVLGGDYLVFETLTGVPWNQVEPDSPAELRRELGRLLATLSTVTQPPGAEPVFGAPHAGLSGHTWRAAFLTMLDALLSDTVRFPTPLPVPAEEMREVAERAAWALEEVEQPRLVHFDVWLGNVFLSPGARAPIQAIIDHERAFWGDPLAELLMPTLYQGLDEADPLVAGYREVAPLDLGPAARVRLLLYKMYLYTIFLVENGPRQYPEEDYAPMRDNAIARLGETVAALR